MLLVVNFGINIAESEIPGMDEETKQTFDTVDHCFTVFYVLELLLNLFVNWFWPFVCNGWSMFDALAVLMSVVGALLNTFSSGQNMTYLSVIRSIRMYVALFKHCRTVHLGQDQLAIIGQVMSGPLCLPACFCRLMN
jgi:hypothetical protein